ncbi:MAG: DUF2298 domain-containing protein [Chloroflexi bacterium]|nr:DUF2298 domain-containing protein [Chloroflexota bacterium]
MRRLNHFRLPQPSTEHLLLLLIVVVAVALRINGLNWDSGYGFHPDERSLYMRAGCMYDLLTERPGYEDCLKDHPQIEPGLPGLRTLLEFDRSPLNPHWFPLGSVLIYTLVFFRSVIELFTDVNALDMRYVGRLLSALADVGTVTMVYLLGRRIYGPLYGPWVGLLGAALTALAVIHVQHSHFYRPETFTAFWVLTVFWAMFQVMERARLRDSLILGILVGLAFAPKVSILPIALPLAICYWYRLLNSGNGRRSGITRPALEQTFFHALTAFAAALAVFFLVTPYALLYLSNFLGEQAAQTNMAQNAGLWPFTIQYVGTPTFLYQFKQTAVWGLGPPLGLVAWGSIIFSAFLVWQGSFARRADILILAWLVPSILFLESFEVRFQRYYFALIPFMILLGSRMLLWAPFYLRGTAEGASRRRSFGRPQQALTVPADRINRIWSYLRNNPSGQRVLVGACWGLVAIVVVSTLFYSLAFQRVYLNPHPAVSASQWINEEVPAGAAIVNDNHWDDSIPELVGKYRVWQFPAYEPDGIGKMAELAGQLANADYLVFYSQRPYVSVVSDPERFPLSIEYYRQLFAGELGYRLEKTFSSDPGFLGINITDNPFGRTDLPRPEPLAADHTAGITLDWGYADDNVVGYDHPTVFVFRNVEKIPAESLVGKLAGGQAGPITALKFSEAEWVTQQESGTWSEIFDRGSLANQVPLLVWVLVIEVVYLISLPLCLFLFRPLADRGIVLARIIGLLGVAYITWLIVSLGLVELSRGAILFAIMAMAGLSGWTLLAYRHEMWEFIRARWRILATTEGLFLAAFLVFAIIRSLNPDLWHPYRGGEKPMEFAYFNAVLKSGLLPPYDPWFAGGYLNYYYWGYFILAIPTRLTGIVPAVAFNLAVPLLFALTVTGAYSVVYNLAEGFRRSRRPATSSLASVAEVEADSEYAGDYSANPAEKYSGLERALRSPITAGFTAALFVAVIGNLDGLLQILQGVGRRLGEAGASVFAFDFWRSSRMLPNLESIEPNFLTFWLWNTSDKPLEISWHITEFPFFSFLFADLHAHMMAIPFTILVIGLSLSLVAGYRKLGWTWDLAVLLTLGIAVGSLWLINSWDYPSFLLLALAAAGIAAYRGWAFAKGRATAFAIMTAIIVVVGVLAFLPFHQAVETFGTGVEVSRWKTPLVNFLGIHGLFLTIIVVFLAWQARRPLYVVFGRSYGLAYLDKAVETDAYRRSFQRWLRIFALAGALLVVFFALAGYFTVAAMTGMLVLTGLAAWDAATSRDRGQVYGVFPLVLTGLALGLIIGVDLVRVEDDIGRMNTLFKYYLEAWVLLALASAFFLWRLWYDSRFRPFPFDLTRVAWFAFVALLILVSLIYPLLGTPARVADRFNPLSPTLDGMAYMEEAVHWEKDQSLDLKQDREAIVWLQDNVVGSPVILEAHTEQYRWGGRISKYTGLPTVLGWPWHQIQQRGPYGSEVHERARDVEEIYASEDLALAHKLLAKYQVSYVVVGDLERIFYPGAGLGKFDIMAQLGTMVKVYDDGLTSIYRLAQNSPTTP